MNKEKKREARQLILREENNLAGALVGERQQFALPYNAAVAMIIFSILGLFIVGLSAGIVFQPNPSTKEGLLASSSPGSLNLNFNKSGFNFFHTQKNPPSTLFTASIESKQYIYSIGSENNKNLLLSRLVLTKGALDISFGLVGFVSTQSQIIP